MGRTAWCREPYAHVMSGAGPLDPPPDSPEARRWKTAGTWVGYLIFALVLLFLIVLTAQYAYQHQWADFTGAIVFTLLFLIIPTGESGGYVTR